MTRSHVYAALVKSQLYCFYNVQSSAGYVWTHANCVRTLYLVKRLVKAWSGLQ